MENEWISDDGSVKLICGDCLEWLPKLEENDADIIITSPPYWNQREYSNWSTYEYYMIDMEKVIGESSRLISSGRHVFWVIPDKLPWPPKENGQGERLYMPVYADSEHIASKHGFMCEFPVIWDKRGPNLTEQPWSKKMWGSYPYPITIIHTPFTERICVWRKPGNHNLTQKDRQDSKITSQQFNDWACDIWSIRVSTEPNHPATFPVDIPNRIITLWSRKNDTVLDPFMGSGTTGIACVQTGRKFIGIEIDRGYYNIAKNRIQDALKQMRLPGL